MEERMSKLPVLFILAFVPAVAVAQQPSASTPSQLERPKRIALLLTSCYWLLGRSGFRKALGKKDRIL